MTAATQYERKSIGWVLARTRSVLAPVIQRRIDAGEGASARIFSVGGQRFAQVQFDDIERADLVLALEAHR